jgi:hypothetical protein
LSLSLGSDAVIDMSATLRATLNDEAHLPL